MPTVLTRCLPESGSARPELLVFSDDWGRHPSSCQHLVRRLLGRYQVWWVNTIGMRRPSWDWATCCRAWEKLYTWLGWRSQPERRNPLEKLPRSTSLAGSTQESSSSGFGGMAAEARSGGRLDPTHPGLVVLNPWMWPWFRRKLDRRINRALLLRTLEPVVRHAQGPVVAVTTLPVVADLMGVLPVARWVYYCVDDFSKWPGLDHQAIETLEQKVVRRAELVIAASQTLQDRLAGLGRSARLLTHGVDLEHWRVQDSSDAGAILATSAEMERPWIVFWGLIDRRMDVEWVARLASDLERGTILLVGPMADPEPRLLELARVQCPGPVDYQHLPLLARQADVLIMPYADLPVTRAMQPLKLLEYLATGKPVVVRRLPATKDWTDALDEVDSAEAFSQMVRRRVQEGLPSAQTEARNRLENESWDTKARLLEQWIFETELPHRA